MSAGAYGWPIDSAADIAVETLRATRSDVEEARFVMVNETSYAEFERALNQR